MAAKRILIVEDDFIIALTLELAAIDAGFRVVGPSPTVSGGQRLATIMTIDGAILDANLLDGEITPLAGSLFDLGIPFVIHSATGVPDALLDRAPDTILVRKPASSHAVVARLEALFPA